MMCVKILGPSCGKCVRLESLVIEILQELGETDAIVEKIAEPSLIDRYLVEDPPGLLINEKLYWGGGDLPGREQLRGWLKAAAIDTEPA